MKRTTIIMASVTFAMIAVLIGIFIFMRVNSIDDNEYIEENRIVISGDMETRTTPPFSALDITAYVYYNSNYRTLLNFREWSNIDIVESDSVAEPAVTLSSGWDKYIDIDVTGDTLNIAMRYDFHRNHAPHSFTATDPITVTVPRGMLRSVYADTKQEVIFNGFRSDSIKAKSDNIVIFKNCDIEIAEIVRPSDSGDQNIELNNSTFSLMNVVSNSHSTHIYGSDDSFIATLTCPDTDDTGIDAHSTPIGNFMWDGKGDCKITFSSTIGLRLSTESKE